jgi:nucleoid-associated protein YgaU
VRKSPDLMFVARTAAAALLTMILAASWALIVNQRVLTSTVPVSHQSAVFPVPLFTPIPPPVVLPLTIVYRVRLGDTLWGISQHADMSWRSLYALNRKIIGGNPNLIYPGEKLTI